MDKERGRIDRFRRTPVDSAVTETQAAAAHDPLQAEGRTLDAAAFAAMVKKGTKAWADVPADWLEALRGNTDDE